MINSKYQWPYFTHNLATPFVVEKQLDSCVPNGTEKRINPGHPSRARGESEWWAMHACTARVGFVRHAWLQPASVVSRPRATCINSMRSSPAHTATECCAGKESLEHLRCCTRGGAEPGSARATVRDVESEVHKRTFEKLLKYEFNAITTDLARSALAVVLIETLTLTHE